VVKEEQIMAIEPYVAAVCQVKRLPVRVGGPSKIKENIEAGLKRYAQFIDYCCAGGMAGKGRFSITGAVRLVTFCEYAITGSYTPADPTDHRYNNQETLRYLAIRIPGSETDVLAAKAKQYGIYVAAANIEHDPAWPDIHFNTGFIINPDGKVILKYQKTLTNNPTEIACSAHDIMDKYINPITGEPDPFPVVDTEIGRLALMICADLGSPELPRIYSMKGAEVVIHLTSGNAHSMGGPRSMGITEAVKRVRAYDNAIYFINSNCGPTPGAWYPEEQISGHSAIIDYKGNVLAEDNTGGEMVVRAEIDIESARRYRARYYHNSITQLRSELIAPYYMKPVYPANTFLKDGPLAAGLDERQQKYFTMALENLKKHEHYYRETDIRQT
jgi:predicted amidohydrolase